MSTVTTTLPIEHAHDDHAHHANATDVFGFWLYILTDCILFGTLFATYIVLNHPNAYGPTLKEYINLPYILLETLFLLASNLTFGMAMISFYQKKQSAVQLYLLLTFILGACFVGMELYEFAHLVSEGYSWSVSGGASAFFTLVGTHGLHVSVGLFWILAMIAHIKVFKINLSTERRLIYLGLFWNFLDIVWIFVFTTVYLMGAL